MSGKNGVSVNRTEVAEAPVPGRKVTLGLKITLPSETWKAFGIGILTLLRSGEGLKSNIDLSVNGDRELPANFEARIKQELSDAGLADHVEVERRQTCDIAHPILTAPPAGWSEYDNIENKPVKRGTRRKMVHPTRAEPREGYRVFLQYDDGAAGEMDLSHLAGRGVFQAWDTLRYFQRVHITPHGSIAWDEDLELCPQALYIQLTGKPPEEVMTGLHSPVENA